MRERIQLPRSLARKKIAGEIPAAYSEGADSVQPPFCFQGVGQMQDKFEVEIDPRPNVRVMTVCGVKYSFDIFSTLAFPRTDRLFKFKREGDVVIVTDCGPAPAEVETAMLASAQPKARKYERR
jgi:hypothetical protein